MMGPGASGIRGYPEHAFLLYLLLMPTQAAEPRVWPEYPWTALIPFRLAAVLQGAFGV
jgi:hypothetical protein